ncbi:MAG: flavodoxin FldA [Rikenellaceae bacterium]
MKKTLVVFGSTTGTCETIAQSIAEKLGVSAIEVSELTADTIAEYEALVLGTSTWGDGELQDDWYDGVAVLKDADLTGKTIALFGCGDGESYCDTFCDGMGLIYNDIKDSGCTIVGEVDAAGYSYSSSVAEVDGKFVGLALDDMNESEKTDDRIDTWVETLKAAL